MSPAGHRTGPAPLDRERVVGLLAAFGDRAPETVDDAVGSLELTWLIAQVEEQYAVRLDLRDEQLARIATVADAADVLREALDGFGDDADSQAGPTVPSQATMERG